MEEKKEKKVEINYEIKMYQLLIVFLIAVFASLWLGLWLGEGIGYSKGIDAVDIETPDYCYAENEGREDVKIVCNELENISLNDLCNTLSKPLEHKVKILLIAG